MPRWDTVGTHVLELKGRGKQKNGGAYLQGLSEITCPSLPTPHSPNMDKHPNTQLQSSLWRPLISKLMSPTVCIFNFKWCFKKLLKYYFPRKWLQEAQIQMLPFIFHLQSRQKEQGWKFSFPCSRFQPLNFSTTSWKNVLVEQHDSALTAPKRLSLGVQLLLARWVWTGVTPICTECGQHCLLFRQ